MNQLQAWVVGVGNTGTMTDKKILAMKLVPPYSGDGSVSEWLEKLKAMCALNGVEDEADVVYIMAVRLAGGAYTLYQQMPEDKRKRRREIESVLLAAYEVNAFVAFDQFKEKQLEVGESVDEYLATLRKLAKLMGGVSDQVLLCAFVSGLPDQVRDVIRAGVNVNGMTLDDALIRARAAMKDGSRGDKCGAMAPIDHRRRIRSDGRKPSDRHGSRPTTERFRGEVKCFYCGDQGHMKLRCPQVSCFKCGQKGHMAVVCSENEVRGQI